MKRLTSLPILAVLIFACATLLDGAWTTRRLTNNTGVSAYSAIAINGANVYLVWQDDTPGQFDVYFRRSTDSGATWQSIQRLTYSSGSSGEPVIAVSGTHVYAAWFDDTPGNFEIYFRHSADGGSTWQAVQRITNNAGDSQCPAIAASGASVFLFWSDDTPGNAEIYFSKSTDNGAAWGSAQRLTNNSGDSIHPAAAIKSANVYLVWNDSTPGNQDIYFRRSTDNGATWQTVKRLTHNSGGSDRPAIAAVNANVYVDWSDDTPGTHEIYFRRSTDNGSTWQAALRPANTMGESESAKIAASGAKVYLAWNDDTPGNLELYFVKSVDGGATWGTAKRLTNNAGISGLPDLAVDATNVYVTYCDNTPGDMEVYLKYSPL